MKRHRLISLAYATSFALASGHATSIDRGHSPNLVEVIDRESLICLLRTADILYTSDETEKEGDCMYFCETASYQEYDAAEGMLYSLNLTDSVIESIELMRHGNIYLEIPGGIPVRTQGSVSAYINYPPGTVPLIMTHEDTRHRKLNHAPPARKTLGVSNLLVLRVSGLDLKTAVSKEVIHGRIFGIGNLTEEVTAVGQFDACSYSKFNIIPAEGPEIDNGVGDLLLNFNLATMNAAGLQNTLKSETDKKFGRILDNFDHVMFCLPRGIAITATRGTDWEAYAYLRGFDSYFNGENCENLSAVMHELGHNLGQAHSREGRDFYGDTTGWMGRGNPNNPKGPAKCYNAAKLYFLKWYEETVHEINIYDLVKNPWGGFIYGVVDRDRMPDYGYNIVKLQHVFVSYNRAISFNRGTSYKRDQVLLHQAWDPDFTSDLVLGGHNPGNDVRNNIVNFYKWTGVGLPLNFELCYVDWRKGDLNYLQRVRMSIHFSTQNSTCNVNLFSEAPSNTPTHSNMPSDQPSTSITPTEAISEVPSVQPSTSMTPTVTTSSYPSGSNAPSAMHSVSPSTQPSFDPSISPTQVPSTEPSLFPTQVPTTEPSIAPSFLPSIDPTQIPTTEPSAFPSLLPSVLPTQAPSVVPSLSQSPSSHCEDHDEVYFWDDPVTRTKVFNCFDLAKNSELKEQMCYDGHSAFDVCEDTCGKCNDNCDDLTGMFFANQRVGYRDCQWLIGKPGFQKHLCQPGTDAFELCGDTCNRCEVGATSMPSVAPQALAPSGSCEDTKGTFVVNARGRTQDRNCVWLARSKVWQGRLCVPGHEAYQVCPELCGACTDDCHDSQETFFAIPGFENETCEWLSIRPRLAKKLCVPSHPAYKLCAETCNTC